MSNAEAIKLISNIKFEEGPTISTALDPYTTHFWAREVAVFLTRISAVHLVVHNDERAQSDTWFGYVLTSDSCTSVLGACQAIELGVTETTERPRKALRDPDDPTSARVVNLCRQKIYTLDAIVSKVILNSLSKDPSAQFPGGLYSAVTARLESEQMEYFDDRVRSSKFKRAHHVLRVVMQMLAVFAAQARIVLEDKLRNESLPSESPAEITAYVQRARGIAMGLVTMGVPPPTVSGLLQQSIMRQPFQSVAGFELKREVALKGDPFALLNGTTFQNHRDGEHGDSHGSAGGQSARPNPVGI
jgi:hypothetical protein